MAFFAGPDLAKVPGRTRIGVRVGATVRIGVEIGVGVAVGVDVGVGVTVATASVRNTLVWLYPAATPCTFVNTDGTFA
jgi:hypothetical protein